MTSEKETCRYTGKPLSKCRCKDGCKSNSVQAGEWIQPVRKGYRMECCDCGLVHVLDFRIYRGKIQFRAYREPAKKIKSVNTNGKIALVNDFCSLRIEN